MRARGALASAHEGAQGVQLQGLLKRCDFCRKPVSALSKRDSVPNPCFLLFSFLASIVSWAKSLWFPAGRLSIRGIFGVMPREHSSELQVQRRLRGRSVCCVRLHPVCHERHLYGPEGFWERSSWIERGVSGAGFLLRASFVRQDRRVELPARPFARSAYDKSERPVACGPAGRL